MWRCVLLLAGCNQFYGLDETESRTDRDADGVDDIDDNCPDIANADQLNEDLDGFGNVCDKCPAASDVGGDGDGDGVGDLCDPSPEPGDCLVLFDTFTDPGVLQEWRVERGVAPQISAGAARFVGGTNVLVAAGFAHGTAELGGFATSVGLVPLLGLVAGVGAASPLTCLWHIAINPMLEIAEPDQPPIATGGFVGQLETSVPPAFRIQWATSPTTSTCAARLVYYLANLVGAYAVPTGEAGIVSVDVSSVVEYFAIYARGAACTPTVFR